MKTRVYFGVFGFTNYAEVTAHMEINPDAAWNYGDGVDTNGKKVGTNTARWIIGDLDYTEEDINEKISKVGLRLCDAHLGMLSFPSKWQRKYVIVTMGGNESFDLTINSIRWIESARADIWVDIYRTD